jgi:hypothetical protein
VRDRAKLRVLVQHVRAWPADGAVCVVSAMRTPDALEAILTDIARRFADGVLEAVCAASLGELRETSGATPAPRPPARAELAGEAAARAETPPSPPRVRATTTRNVAIVVAAVRAAGDAGIVGEKLRAAVGLSRPIFHNVLRLAVDMHAVRKTGRLRGMRYFAS